MKHARDERVAGSKFSMRTKKKPATENFERGLEKFFAAIFAAQLYLVATVRRTSASVTGTSTATAA
jgi:hypothetical protein